jgi:hypothetical protein
MFEGQVSPPDVSGRGENMLAPDEVAAMVRLTSLGWGTRKIAAALGCSRGGADFGGTEVQGWRLGVPSLQRQV